MTVIFENKRGKVKFAPGTSKEVSITIPETHSALGMMSRNNMYEGDFFANNGYVYNNKNKKTRKWFSYCEGWNHFWEPCLNDVAHLEQVYHKLTLRSDKRYARLAELLQRISKTKKTTNKYGQKVWMVHATPSRPENQSEGQCWAYEVERSTHFDNQLAFSMTWVEVPKKYRHLDLGNELYHLEQVVCKSSMLYGMEHALDKAFIRALKKNNPEIDSRSNVGNMFEIRINNRRYIYIVSYNRANVPQLVRHAWPGDKYNIVEL
jgi:hypothetical protein